MAYTMTVHRKRRPRFIGWFRRKKGFRGNKKKHWQVARGAAKSKAFVTPKSRLSGYVKMSYLKLSRCYDGPNTLLSSATHIAPGFWASQLYSSFSAIPAAVTLAAMYRFFKIKKFVIQYTPTVRSDAYSKLIVVPPAIPGVDLFQQQGGALEIKHLPTAGYLPTPTTWAECLNRSGYLRRCPGVTPFTRTIYPKIQQIVEDTVATDPTRMINSPWLSTDIASNLTLVHYLGVDTFHTLNDLSYDSNLPLRLQMRYVVEVEFKGLKI